MYLHDIVARRLESEKRLKGVPQAVVEDVLRLGFDMLAEHLTDLYVAVEYLAMEEWVCCEACENFGQPETMKVVHSEEDGILHFCEPCHLERAAP